MKLIFSAVSFNSQPLSNDAKNSISSAKIYNSTFSLRNYTQHRHPFGFKGLADTPKLIELCKIHNLKLVEDNAQSHGCIYGVTGMRTGTLRNHLNLPVTDRIASQELSLPAAPYLSSEETGKVVELINAFGR